MVWILKISGNIVFFSFFICFVHPETLQYFYGMSREMNTISLCLFSTAYGFLQPAHAEMFARQQEMLRKQNLARYWIISGMCSDRLAVSHHVK